MAKPFRHSKIDDTKRFKRIKKSEITFCKLVTGVLIFTSTRSKIFFKVGILKNFGASFEKLQASFYRTPMVAAFGFSRQQ